MKPVRFHPEAEGEIENASDFYDRQRSGLGVDFEDELETALRRVSLMPSAFPPHRIDGVRKCLLSRFPYTAYFAEMDDHIWVVAVAHQKRRPDYWAGRRPN